MFLVEHDSQHTQLAPFRPVGLVQFDSFQITEEERKEFFANAAENGIGGRLIPKYFTCVGKFKVKHKWKTL